MQGAANVLSTRISKAFKSVCTRHASDKLVVHVMRMGMQSCLRFTHVSVCILYVHVQLVVYANKALGHGHGEVT